MFAIYLELIYNQLKFNRRKNMTDLNIVFYSKNNYALGEKLRDTLKKMDDTTVKYCNDLKDLTFMIENQSNNLIFLDKSYKKYANFVKQLLMTNLKIIENVRFVFVDDELEFYVNMINNERLFIIPESNLESALYNTITRCKFLDCAKEYTESEITNYSEIISEELRKLGFSYKLVGFRYIKQCMEQAIKNNFMLGALHKDVYPHIGMQNSTSVFNIERGIRTAILDASKQDCFHIEDSANHKSISNRFFLEYLLDKLIIYKNRQVG